MKNNWRSYNEKEIATRRSGEMNMSTILVSERIEEVSPRTKARMAGGFYLATILTGVGGAHNLTVFSAEQLRCGSWGLV